MPYLNLDKSIAAAAPVVVLGPLTNEGKTLAQMRDRLHSALGNRDDADDPDYNEWINDAYLLIASGLKLKETRGSFTFNTVVGQPFYLLPSSLVSISQLSLGDATDYPVSGGAPLEKIDVQVYRQEADWSGTPRAFLVSGRLLILYPTPDTVHPIYIDGQLRPTKMAADNDSPILPLEWHRGLFIKAKVFAYEDNEEFESAKECQNSYVRFLREIGDPQADEEAGMFASLRPVRSLRDLRRSRSLTRVIEPGDSLENL